MRTAYLVHLHQLDTNVISLRILSQYPTATRGSTNQLLIMTAEGEDFQEAYDKLIDKVTSLLKNGSGIIDVTDRAAKIPPAI